jgi:hypothetical protein
MSLKALNNAILLCNFEEKFEDITAAIRGLYSKTDSLRLEIEDIFKNRSPSDEEKDLLGRVLELYDISKAMGDETLLHLSKMNGVTKDLLQAIQNLQSEVVSSTTMPRISENDWEAKRKFDALIRVSKRERPDWSDKIRVVRPSQQPPGMGEVYHTSMQMSPKRMSRHLEYLRRKLAPNSSVNPNTRSRVMGEVSALEGLMLNRERDRSHAGLF